MPKMGASQEIPTSEAPPPASLPNSNGLQSTSSPNRWNSDHPIALGSAYCHDYSPRNVMCSPKRLLAGLGFEYTRKVDKLPDAAKFAEIQVFGSLIWLDGESIIHGVLLAGWRPTPERSLV